MRREEHSLAICLSDLHVGKISEGFDRRVAVERIRSVPEKICGCRSDPRVVGVLLVGDLVEGEGIWPAQTAVNECGARQQVGLCAEALWEMLQIAHARWPRARVLVRSVRGNHGRISSIASPDSNLDAMTVDLLREKARGSAWCDVVSCSTLALVAEIGGLRIAMLHRAEKHAATAAMIGRVLRRLAHYRADLMIAGHWHTPAVYSIDGALRYVTLGSLCGPDDYAEQIGVYDPPSQAVIHIAGGRASAEILTW